MHDMWENFMKINTVIFDIGGVLVGYNWDKYLMDMFNDCTKVDRIKNALFYQGVWAEVDRGVWSEEQLLEAFYKNGAGIEADILKFWNAAGGALWQYDFTKPFIADLKSRGFRVLYLSNWSEHMRIQAEKQLDFLPMMDGGVFSYEEKLIKPDHKIYHRIVEKYSLNAEECVFLDDTKANVEAAIACGLNGIHVSDHDKAHEELYRMIE